MSDAFRFETFVDVYGSIFNEYLSSVTAKLSKEDEGYKALQAEIEGTLQVLVVQWKIFCYTVIIHYSAEHVEYRMLLAGVIPSAKNHSGQTDVLAD